MQVKDKMTKHVEVARPDEAVKEAAAKMKAMDIGVLPVCDGQRLVGMLTDRDIAVRLVAEAKDANLTKVKEVMSPQVEWCFEDEDEKEVAEKMKNKLIRRLPVISHDKKLVGMLSLGDLAVRGNKKTACEILEKVSAQH